ncbi:MAG: type II toxin-antitoxin system VapC family toxin [Caulobacteraceae bacterium]|nr:type II toxin-antitoxin system VapC family toxin [Caulobacteraceae bacterium]
MLSMFVQDAGSSRAWDFILEREPIAVVSDFAAAEFASALNLRVRAGRLAKVEAQTALDAFDLWRRAAAGCRLESADIAAAEIYLRRLDLPLRALDALHLALVERLGFELATFDLKMAASARALEIAVAIS